MFLVCFSGFFLDIQLTVIIKCSYMLVVLRLLLSKHIEVLLNIC